MSSVRVMQFLYQIITRFIFYFVKLIFCYYISVIKCSLSTFINFKIIKTIVVFILNFKYVVQQQNGENISIFY